MAGPFWREIDRPLQNFHQYKFWYTQKRPYKVPLEYIFVQKRDSKFSHNESVAGRGTGHEAYRTQARNRAYNKLLNSLGDASQIAASIAEWRSTASSISNNCVALLGFARAVKRGRFTEANRALGIRKGFRPKAKELGNRWLEYSFGWAPLVKDIYNGIDVLQRPLPSEAIKGIGRYGGRFLNINDGTTLFTAVSTARCEMGGRISVVNPNLYVANQLGLVNPAAVVWELIPFSFVVDWFFNVSQVLGTLSDFAGCVIQDGYTTHYDVTNTVYYWPVSSPQYFYENECIEVTRTVGLSGPTLAPKPFTGFSVTRGANSIALLLQLLK